MIKSIFSFTAATALLLLTSAFPLAADTTYIQAGIGYRQDSIKSELKDHSYADPRASSKRHFKDLEILLLGVNAKTTLGCMDAYVRASFDYGFVLDGKLKDKFSAKSEQASYKKHHEHVAIGTYLDNTVHHNIKSDSYVWDFDIAFAYPVPCQIDGWEIAPAIGFAVDRQNLRVKTHRHLKESYFGDEFFTVEKTKRTLKNCWWSPWLGFDFAYKTCDCLDVYGTFEFHIGKAHRKLQSNLEGEYCGNYKRSKTFYGPLFKLGTIYMFCENWYADANITYRKYFSESSRDQFTWASGSLRLDVGYVF